MTTRARLGALFAAALVAVTPSLATARQDPRLDARLAPEARQDVISMLDSARTEGLPVEPMIDRALEGATKGAAPQLIVRAVERLLGELRVARDALGEIATPGELSAGASAIRAGATAADLEELRFRRPGQILTVAAGVLADLVAVGVPADTAVAAVLALAAETDDSEYVAFRRNVERDIALGASPTAALGVRLQAMADALSASSPTFESAGASSGGQRRPRKP
jgi:hypothetical protein